MLTMLHAKTLSRKRFGNSAESAVTSDDGLNNSHPAKSRNSGSVGTLVAKITQLFRKKSKLEHVSTAPTSTGKLLNIMRCVISIIRTQVEPLIKWEGMMSMRLLRGKSSFSAVIAAYSHAL